MGQKVNPHGARVGVIKDWSTRWYADKKDFADNLVSDAKLRKMIKNLEFVDDKSKKSVKLYDAGISHVDIERRFDNDKVRVTVTVHVARLRKRFEGWQEFEIESVRGLGYKAVKRI